MPGLRVVLALLLAALPLAASAEGVNFTVPLHYLVAAPAPNAQLPPVFRVWDRNLGGVRHSIVVSSSPATADLKSTIDATLAGLAARHAINVSRTDAGQLCGMPSVQIAYAYANQLTYVFRYAVVGQRLLIASYAHPLGTDADPPALASLDTLCSGIHQPATPKGWTIMSPYPPNANAWHPSPGDPDSKTLLDQVAFAAKPGEDLVTRPYSGKGTLVSDRQASCAAVAIRRMTVNFDDGRIAEYSAGTVNGYNYVVAYVRQPSETADPAAMAVLTSFCENTLPPS